MHKSESKYYTFKLVEKIQKELMDIQLSCSDFASKERICKLLNYIDGETVNNKEVFIEKLHHMMKISKKSHPEINADLYILYRNLLNDKITIQEAEAAYEMYVKEL